MNDYAVLGSKIVRYTLGPGVTPFRRISTADANNALVSTGVHTLYNITAINTNATVRYLKIFDKAIAPVAGTDTTQIVMTIPLPANVPVNLSFAAGFPILLGLGMALVTGVADNASTGVAAGEQIVHLLYT